MSDKKWCLRFKRTKGGRRCARFGNAGQKRNGRTCKVFQKTRSGVKRCARYEEE